MNLIDYYINHPNFKVMEDEETGLFCASYVHLGVDWEDERNRMGRGIVLDSDGNIVSKGYDKFFNYKEFENRENCNFKDLSEWEDGKYTVTEKIDGSMVLVSHHNGEFVISSSSSITNEYTKLFKEELKRLDLITETMYKGVYFKNMCQEFSFVFEYISPETQVVLPYNEIEMIFHGLIDRKNGQAVFLTKDNVEYISHILKVKHKTYLDLTKEEILKKQRTDTDIEGWVVQFESGKMLKFKTDWYLNKHREFSFFFGKLNTAKKREMVLDWYFNGELDDYIAYSNQRMNNDYSVFLSDCVLIISISEKMINKMISDLRKLINSGQIDKRTYARERAGENKLQDILFYALYDNRRSAVKKIKRNEILEYMRENLLYN